jgi:hypothetical protein
MEKHPLHLKNPELQASPEVERAVLRAEQKTGEKVPNNPAKRIEAYMDRLKNIFLNPDERKRERNLEMFRDKIYDALIIKPDVAAEQILKDEAKVAMERGHGRIEITEEIKNRPETQKQAEAVIKRQKASLDEWMDYLTGNDASSYDPWFKYYLWNSITKLQTLAKIEKTDERTGEKTTTAEYPKRTAGTLKPFPDIFRGKLAQIYDKYNKYTSGEKTDTAAKQYFQKNFAKLYAEESLDHIVNSSSESKEQTHGEWVKYEQGNMADAEKMITSLQDKYTDWCIEGEGVGKDKLNEGDIYIYYTFDASGNPVDPRLCIRMSDTRIAEVRGISGGKSQEVEQVFMDENSEGGSVLGSKLKEFGSEADTYKKRESDMKYVTRLMKKNQNDDPFTKEELQFLYEINGTIEGFGYQKDPRIDELRQGRNTKADFVVVTGFPENQISVTEEEALSGGIKYHYGSLDLSSLTSATGLKLPEHISGDLDFSRLTSSEGLELPKFVGGYLNLSSLTSAEGLKLPEHISGDLYLHNLTSAEGLKLPEHISGDLYLHNLTSAEGLKLPEHIGGSLDLHGLTSAEGLELPKSVGGSLNLSSLTSAAGLKLPESVGGSVYLNNLTSAEGLELPEHIGGSLDLHGLTSAEGLKLPEHISGDLDLNNLTSAEGLELPKSVGRSLNLNNLTSAEGLKLPESVGGDLNLSSLTSAEGLKLPEHIGRNLDLNNLTSAEGLELPKSVGRSLNLNNLTSAAGLKLPESVGGDLNLSSLTSAEGLKLPEHIGRNLDLNNLTSAEGLELPKSVGGSLNLSSLTSAEKDNLRAKYPNLDIR